MIRLHTLAASALLATFMLLPASAARADFSISFSTSSGYGSSHGHGYRGHPQRSHSHRGHRGYGSLPYRHAPRVYGAPGRHVLGAGCRPITERAYDRFGRLVLLHRSLCYDRFGRPYLLGGHRGYRH